MTRQRLVWVNKIKQMVPSPANTLMTTGATRAEITQCSSSRAHESTKKSIQTARCGVMTLRALSTVRQSLQRVADPACSQSLPQATTTSSSHTWSATASLRAPSAGCASTWMLLSSGRNKVRLRPGQDHSTNCKIHMSMNRLHL